MSDDYRYGLTYHCSNVNSRTGDCRRATVDVIARSRDMSQKALDDVMRHADDLCVRPSEFRTVGHEGRLLLSLISSLSCSVITIPLLPLLAYL